MKYINLVIFAPALRIFFETFNFSISIGVWNKVFCTWSKVQATGLDKVKFVQEKIDSSILFLRYTLLYSHPDVIGNVFHYKVFLLPMMIVQLKLHIKNQNVPTQRQRFCLLDSKYSLQ